jgi:hypothetical protein
MRQLRVIATLAFSLASLHAQEEPRPTPDGIYKPTSLEAYVTFAGKRLNLPIRTLRTALLRDGLIPVRDKRIRIQKSKWGPVLEKFNFLGIDGDASVQAPDNLVFKRDTTGADDRFSAQLSYPLHVSMKGRYKWVPATVRMKTPLNSTIKGDNMLIDAPLSITVLHITAKGRLRLTAERKISFP